MEKDRKSTDIVGVRMPPDMKRRLVKMAEESDLTVSQIIRRLVRDGLGIPVSPKKMDEEEDRHER